MASGKERCILAAKSDIISAIRWSYSRCCIQTCGEIKLTGPQLRSSWEEETPLTCELCGRRGPWYERVCWKIIACPDIDIFSCLTKSCISGFLCAVDLRGGRCRAWAQSPNRRMLTLEGKLLFCISMGGDDGDFTTCWGFCWFLSCFNVKKLFAFHVWGVSRASINLVLFYVYTSWFSL